MAARKKRTAAPKESKAGRKKDVKRFELELVGAGSYARGENGGVPTLICANNEIAFVVRTSGGTPLNVTDTGKLFRLLQHELRSLGHQLKRKGQELDPKADTVGESAQAALDQMAQEKQAASASDQAAEPTDPDSESQTESPADPDDPDAHTDSPTPQ